MIRNTRIAAPIIVAFGLLAASASCKKSDKPEEKTDLAPAATELAPSKAAASLKTYKVAIDTKGKTSIDMPAPNEHIKAETTSMQGSLEVDPINLANTRGEIKADLTTLSTRTFDDEKKNATQSEHARTWLEAVVENKVNESFRYAVLAIRSIDGLSATDLTKVTPTKEGDEDVRVVTMTVHGEFLVHGHKSNKDAKVEAKFHHASGAAADGKPLSIEMRTVEPMHIVLAEHDVKPRDTFGKLAQKSFDLLGTKVATTADVTVMVRAVPGS